jgi:hypothetical protein
VSSLDEVDNIPDPPSRISCLKITGIISSLGDSSLNEREVLVVPCVSDTDTLNNDFTEPTHLQIANVSKVSNKYMSSGMKLFSALGNSFLILGIFTFCLVFLLLYELLAWILICFKVLWCWSMGLLF